MTDFGYCHARIRGMKSRLLDEEFFERLLAARELSEITSALDETDYSQDIHDGLLRLSGAGGVEEGLRLNLAATFQEVIGFLDGKAKKLIELLLERWDIQNIKTVLRGQHVGASPEEIVRSFVPAGALAESTLVALTKEPDIKAAIDLMATWNIRHSRPLTRNFPAYVTTQTLAALEVALDQDYYASALAELHGRSFNVNLVRDLITRQIDFSNIMILLRLAGEDQAKQAGDFFIDGGREIDRKTFDALARERETSDIITGLIDTGYYEQLLQGLERYQAEHSFASLERSLEEQAIKKTVGLFRAEPLSLACVIAYLWAKVNEIMNVRIVLRAKEARMPAPAIREALVVIS